MIPWGWVVVAFVAGSCWSLFLIYAAVRVGEELKARGEVFGVVEQ